MVLNTAATAPLPTSYHWHLNRAIRDRSNDAIRPPRHTALEIPMLRFALIAALLLPTSALAASLKDFELTRELEKIARQSSEGTPRAMNEDITDQGFTVQGHELINHLSVREAHAVQMRENAETVRRQLTGSICANQGFRNLMARGAVLRYDFTEQHSNRPVAIERFRHADCES